MNIYVELWKILVIYFQYCIKYQVDKGQVGYF